MRRLVVELLGHFRNLLIYESIGAEAAVTALDATPEQIRVLQAQSSLADPARLLRIAEQLVAAEESLRHTLSVRTRLEIALIRCGRAATVATIDEIVRRLNTLRQTELPASAAAAGTRTARTPVLEDPIVKRALEMFDGKVVEVEE